jgi:RimJ/RimL family protein N-acetyltransferase
MRIILETDRLRLREVSQADLDFLATLMSHPEVMRYYPKLATRDETQAWIERQWERYATFSHGIWLVENRLTGEPVGRCGLAIQEVDGVGEPEIGYMMHRPFWRQGYATEAALGVRNWAFETRSLDRVISLVRPENLPSHGVARKLGMRPERETQFAGLRHLVFAVLKDEIKNSA